VADTKSGTPGADAVKVKGTLTWLAVDDALPAEVRLYDRLFSEPHPDAGGKDFMASLNPGSKKIAGAYLERSLATSKPGDRYQFERHGYFVADLVDHREGRPVFNRTATLRDTWAR
ncbi:MAG: glutamine--tRNA ligase, partial [Caldimonas sp.]